MDIPATSVLRGRARSGLRRFGVYLGDLHDEKTNTTEKCVLIPTDEPLGKHEGGFRYVVKSGTRTRCFLFGAAGPRLRTWGHGA